MQASSSRLVAVGLLVAVFLGGGVVGAVVGQRRAAPPSTASSPRLASKLDRFERRLGLSADQRAAVEEQLLATQAELAEVRARGQLGIRQILDDDQVVLYQKMLERQKQRRGKRGKRGNRGKRRDRRERGAP